MKKILALSLLSIGNLLLQAPSFAQPELNAPAASSASMTSAATSEKSRQIELVFVLDTTGSMGGLLEGAKAKIWSIVNQIMQKHGSNTRVKVGLVAYRDRGDAYLTKITPLTENLDQVYTQLMALRAEGGGDMPEDVRSAMHEALNKSGWSKPAQNLSQIMFLVGDAPPHEDYRNVPDTTQTSKAARARGMIINTIQCGDIRETTLPWRNIAQYGGGEYFSIAQDGGVQTIATPYDTELSALGEQIGGTYYAYGGSSIERAEKKAKQAKLEKGLLAAAPKPALAERAVNKAINREAYDEADLLQQLDSGKLQADRLKEEELPDELRKLTPEQRSAKLAELRASRKALQARILELNSQRDKFLQEAAKKQKGSETGFDAAVSAALNKQIH